MRATECLFHYQWYLPPISLILKISTNENIEKIHIWFTTPYMFVCSFYESFESSWGTMIFCLKYFNLSLLERTYSSISTGPLFCLRNLALDNKTVSHAIQLLFSWNIHCSLRLICPVFCYAGVHHLVGVVVPAVVFFPLIFLPAVCFITKHRF